MKHMFSNLESIYIRYMLSVASNDKKIDRTTRRLFKRISKKFVGRTIVDLKPLDKKLIASILHINVNVLSDRILNMLIEDIDLLEDTCLAHRILSDLQDRFNAELQ